MPIGSLFVCRVVREAPAERSLKELWTRAQIKERSGFLFCES